MEYNAYTIPMNGKIPEQIIVSKVGICTKCLSAWIDGKGCTNPECPKKVYRQLKETDES